MALSEQKNYRQIELENLEFKTDLILSSKQENLNYDLIYDHILNEKILELRIKIWAECLQAKSKTVTHEFFSPRTWWQHFKKERFPKWLLEKYPVKLKRNVQKTKVTFRRYAKFPSFNYKSDKRFEKFVIEETLETKEILPDFTDFIEPGKTLSD